jgi:hypothetical protein
MTPRLRLLLSEFETTQRLHLEDHERLSKELGGLG